MASKAEDTVEKHKHQPSENDEKNSQPVPEKSDKTVSDQTNDELKDEDIQNLLDFPGDVDWSTTLILKCDPKGTPYKQFDLALALEKYISPFKIWHLGSTSISYVFLLGLRAKHDADRLLNIKYIKVKGLKCTIENVPTKCVEVVVRWIPPEIDSFFIIEKFKCYGTIVKTEHTRSQMTKWKHVYTNDRRFTIEMKPSVKLEDIPYSIDVKGLTGSVLIQERSPKCFECFYTGHKARQCHKKGCKLYGLKDDEKLSEEDLKRHEENDVDEDDDESGENAERDDEHRESDSNEHDPSDVVKT